MLVSITLPAKRVFLLKPLKTKSQKQLQKLRTSERPMFLAKEPLKLRPLGTINPLKQCSKLSQPNSKPELYLKIAFITESNKWFVSASLKTIITVDVL